MPPPLSVGKDMIPRMSLSSVERLTEEMLVAAARCKVALVVEAGGVAVPLVCTCRGFISSVRLQFPTPHVARVAAMCSFFCQVALANCTSFPPLPPPHPAVQVAPVAADYSAGRQVQ